jgi:hypothetical protein
MRHTRRTSTGFYGDDLRSCVSLEREMVDRMLDADGRLAADSR